MTNKLVARAFVALNTLADDERERIAWEIIHRVEDKTAWDRLVAQPRTREWLAVHAKQALKTYEGVRKGTSYTFVSVIPEHIQREAGYWKGFDDLPGDIRKLAEKKLSVVANGTGPSKFAV